MKDGSAVLTDFTALPLKNTAKKSSVAEKLISMAAPKRLSKAKQDCEGTLCPGGCCPNEGWFCCADGIYCAASEEYCKKNSFAAKMISMAAPKRLTKVNQDCDGTLCPGGCCPNAGWFCCPDGEYCAASQEYC